MDPAEYRVEIGQGPETVHQVEQFHLQQGQQQQAGSGSGRVRAQGVPQMQCPDRVLMDDGSCNHMTFPVCGSEFCWVCMKKISHLDYLLPSG